MSYEVGDLNVSFRPIDAWPGEMTPDYARRRSPFVASWNTTIRDLGRELRALKAERVVLQIAIREQDIRLDGLPRQKSVAEHPGVIIAFDSRYGPLKYATDLFTRWEDNLRAIALSMEALRAVDRYGVSKRGEQYTGWRALTTGSDDTGIHTREQAESLIEHYGGRVAAIKATHPDQNPDVDPVEFRRVAKALELVR